IFFFQAEDGIRDRNVTGVQTCALPILSIATCIKNRDISIEECVTVFILHIQQINEKLNAIVENRFTEALQEAALLDDKITSINQIGRASCRERVESTDAETLRAKAG